MAKVVHPFKSYLPIFSFQFLELWNVAFGPNQGWISLKFKWNFLSRGPHGSVPLCPCSERTTERRVTARGSATCRYHQQLSPFSSPPQPPLYKSRAPPPPQFGSIFPDTQRTIVRPIPPLRRSLARPTPLHFPPNFSSLYRP
jgi:hypothetical protein